MKLKYLAAFSFFWLASSAYADFAYCSGKVASIVTRGTAQATYIKLDNNNTGVVTNNMRIGGMDLLIGGRRTVLDPYYSTFEQVQLQMVFDAYYAEETVTIELDTDGFTFNGCTDFEDGIPVRFVGVGSVFE